MKNAHDTILLNLLKIYTDQEDKKKTSMQLAELGLNPQTVKKVIEDYPEVFNKGDDKFKFIKKAFEYSLEKDQEGYKELINILKIQGGIQNSLKYNNY